MKDLPMASPRCCGPQNGEVILGETNLGSTRAWCPECRQVEHALYSSTKEGVFMERICPKKGSQKSPVCHTTKWFMERMDQPITIRNNKKTNPVHSGCPFDCGPCTNHGGQLRLPIFSLTNNCNLKCPICFTHNRPDKVYNKSLDELQAILDHVEAESTNLDLLNLTGGEPSMHPRLFEVLEQCTARSFRRVSMNSNGIILGKNRDFAQKIKDCGVQIILSLDTFDPEKSVLIHGKDIVQEKKDALKMLEDLGIPTALLLVWIPGINDLEVPDLISTYLPKDFICGITIQNMAYTGHYGSQFSPRIHSTLEDVEIGLEKSGHFAQSDFFPHGSYHPFCYSTAYYLVDGEHKLPFTRLVPKDLLVAGTTESFLLKASPELEQAFREHVDMLWAEGAPAAEMNLLKKFIARFNDRDARNKGFFHEMVKTVTIHAHMDDGNFDLARVCACGDLVPDEHGRMIPACSYNLLYRQQDSRFWVEED